MKYFDCFQILIERVRNVFKSDPDFLCTDPEPDFISRESDLPSVVSINTVVMNEKYLTFLKL